MDIFNSPIWQFVSVVVGVVFGIVGIVVAVVLYLKQRAVKRLTYKIISNTSILSLKEQIKLTLKFLFPTAPVADTRLIELKIWNSGNVPIQSDDFKTPITFDFGDEAKVLHGEVEKTDPPSIEGYALVKADAATLTIKPLLLNKKEALTLNITVKNFKGYITDKSRIIGIKQIVEAKKRDFFSPLSVLLICYGICTPIYLITHNTELSFQITIGVIWGLALLFLIIMIAIWVMIVLKSITLYIFYLLGIIIYRIILWFQFRKLKRHQWLLKNMYANKRKN